MKVVYETKAEIVEQIKKTDAFLNRKDEPFGNLCQKIICEIYGEPKREWFDSISQMAPWFNERQNAVKELLNNEKEI